MDEELIPLSEAKTRLHELVKDADAHDRVLLRHGRPIGVLLGYRRYRDLLHGARDRAGGRPTGIAGELRARTGEIERLCRRHGVRRLALFGSAARGEDDPSSDVDVLVEFSPMSPAERADAYFGLLADLERMLGRSVDLVEESTVHNPYVKATIARDRDVIYDAA